jgi:phage gp46-like protein
MAWDFKFDPVTRDTISDGKGSIVLTDAADTMVMHQYAIHFATWWGGRNIGSNLHDLKRFTGKPEISVPAEAARAARVIEERGRIANVQVQALRPSPGRVNLATSFQDVKQGRAVKITTGVDQ